jgi:LacI family repressor for deo operon, udp, cdd, tsx, nupC, and nupG
MTIKDVAKKTNYSVATVSRVINGDSNVAPKTREKILAAIKEMGYVPNLLGRNLRQLASNVVYVLLPSINNSFYSKIVQSIEKESIKTGISIMICETYNEYKRYKNFMDSVRKKLADGIILISPGKPEVVPNFDDIPAVVCCESNNFNCSQVDIDNEQAGYDAVSHLIEIGKKKIAFIGGNFTSSHLRKQGYMRALQEAGLEIIPELIFDNEYYDYEDGLRAAKQILGSNLKPDAIFAVTDQIAFGVIKVFLRAGLKIPQDVAVCGFDNLTYAKMNNPSLTTIMQPREELGAEAFRFLYAKLKKSQTKNKTIILKHKLIKRYSTTGVEEEDI